MKRYLKLIFIIVVFNQFHCKASAQSNNLTKNQPQTVYTVSNLKSFLNALGNNRKIIITHDIYIKEELKQVVTDTNKLVVKGGTPQYINEFYTISGAYSEPGSTKVDFIENNFSKFIGNGVILTIKKASNLTITTTNSSSLIIRQSSDEVIRFENVTHFTLLNLSIFHDIETDGGCGEFAPVISFHNSNTITVDNCKLNGSGTEGIHTNKVKDMTIVHTQVFNCNKRGFSFEKSTGIKINKSKIYSNHLNANSIYYSGPCIFYLRESDVDISSTSITSNISKTSAAYFDADDASVIKFNQCYIADNTNFIATDIIKSGLVEKPFEIIKTDRIYNQYKNYYVNAKSGLNYRASPKGKILGTYPVNTKVMVIEYSKILDQITDGDKTLKGEWVGIQNKMDIVYVFNAFLSSSPVNLDVNIYNLSPYYKEQNGEIRTAFVNVSETYFKHKASYYDMLDEDHLKDTVTLNTKQRKIFLKTIKVSEDDTIFIYDLNKDVIHTHKVKNAPVIACINIYAYDGGNDNIEDDYEFGFDLRKLSTGYNNFVYVGKNNPFQTHSITPIVWKTIHHKDFPIAFDPKIVTKDIRSWFDGVVPEQSYKFTNNNFDYYIQNLEKEGTINYRYLVVFNSNSKEIVFNNVFISSESSYLIPLNIKNETSTYGDIQYTGKIFKNKPPFIFGFTSESFGCPYITFLDKVEPSIRILCDNRH